MRNSIYQLIAYGFYPAWLIAGAVDYFCHRRSAIERTSGPVESLYHLAQFATIAIIVLGIALFEASLTVFVIVVIAVVAHTVLSYLDVRFTERRRYISPLEQHAHAILDAAPLAVVALWITLEWPTSAWAVRLREPMFGQFALGVLLFSVFVVAAGPILEELWRTARAAHRATRDQTGFATIK